jgi:hypothetical protein
MISDIPFNHVIVDEDNPRDPHCKGAGDLDGDGFPDLLAASASGGGLFWYRYPDWSKHKIADGAFTTDMAVADLDGDGHLDVIIPNDEGLICYRNPLAAGGDPTRLWEAINIGAEGARMHDVEVGDLDGDGQMEIVTRHQSGFGKMRGNEIHIWKRRSLRDWGHRTIPCHHGEGLALGDLTGNGRLDIVIGGRWYESLGDVLSGEWIAHPYIPPADFDAHWTRGDNNVAVGDLNGDGRLEIVLSPSEGKGWLAWFASADPRAPEWTAHVLDAEMDHAHGLAVGDISGDGPLDIVYAKMHQASTPQEVAIYHNSGCGESWRKQVVWGGGSHGILLVDIGCDGRLDIYGANWNNRAPNHGLIEFWRNGR